MEEKVFGGRKIFWRKNFFWWKKNLPVEEFCFPDCSGWLLSSPGSTFRRGPLTAAPLAVTFQSGRKWDWKRRKSEEESSEAKFFKKRKDSPHFSSKTFLIQPIFLSFWCTMSEEMAHMYSSYSWPLYYGCVLRKRHIFSRSRKSFQPKKKSTSYSIIPLCWVTLAPPPQNRSGGMNPINQSSQSCLIVNQSINRKVYNQSLRLIDWLILHISGKIALRV